MNQNYLKLFFTLVASVGLAGCMATIGPDGQVRADFIEPMIGVSIPSGNIFITEPPLVVYPEFGYINYSPFIDWHHHSHHHDRPMPRPIPFRPVPGPILYRPSVHHPGGYIGEHSRLSPGPHGFVAPNKVGPQMGHDSNRNPSHNQGKGSGDSHQKGKR